MVHFVKTMGDLCPPVAANSSVCCCRITCLCKVCKASKENAAGVDVASYHYSHGKEYSSCLQAGEHFRSLANCCCIAPLSCVQITADDDSVNVNSRREREKEKDEGKEMKKKVQHSATNLADQQEDAQPASCWAMQQYSTAALYSTADIFLVALKRNTMLKQLPE